ncbi:hypothetical protein, partial [Dialister succinatiphilus]|uniref:hypothetical protein n=1 Tax=Dialister succinatiphilus TaxID=487173 RepID=UPI0040265631
TPNWRTTLEPSSPIGACPNGAHLQPIYILIYYSLFSCKTLEFMIKYHYVVSTYLNKEMGIV